MTSLLKDTFQCERHKLNVLITMISTASEASLAVDKSISWFQVWLVFKTGCMTKNFNSLNKMEK